MRKITKYSQKNLGVIENFILHLTHASCDGDDMFDEPQTFTAKDLYRIAKEYISEDHVDGEDNPEDHIVTYSAESSFDHEDKNKEFPEHIVVVADFGEDVGTQTVATLDNIGDLEALNKLLEFTKNAWKYKYNNL
jgi:hypothetical protein